MDQPRPWDRPSIREIEPDREGTTMRNFGELGFRQGFERSGVRVEGDGTEVEPGGGTIEVEVG